MLGEGRPNCELKVEFVLFEEIGGYVAEDYEFIVNDSADRQSQSSRRKVEHPAAPLDYSEEGSEFAGH